MNYKDLTVITNALNIALILGENHGINLIVTGGEFKAPTLSLTGKMAADSFKDIRANKIVSSYSWYFFGYETDLS